MKKILIILFLPLICSVTIAATYKTNIGAYQTDAPGATYKTNIGSDQTDAAAAEEEEESQVIFVSSIARWSPFAILIGIAYFCTRRKRYGKK